MPDPESPEERNLRVGLGLVGGDEGALEEILRVDGPKVSALLRRKFVRSGVLTEEDVEDVVSVALRRLWDAREQYDDRQAKLGTLLYCIAERVALDLIKSGWQKVRRREQQPGQEIMQEVARACSADPEDGSPKPSSKVLKDLREILHTPPDSERRIVLADAAAKDGVASSQWLAEELGIAAASVRVYRGRAMQKLRDSLAKRGHQVPQPPRKAPK